MMISNDDTCEDEWKELRARFAKEGLEFSSLALEQKLLHVWRWLVDAESNLHSSRRMLDKLREQQNEEMEELECYMGHIKVLAEKRADHLECETISLRNKLDLTQQQTATLNTLLQRCGLQGLDGSGDDRLGEQVAFLIADRAKLMEEIEVLKRIKFSNGMSKESELLSEMVKVSSEKEVLRREVGEMCERLQVLEKGSRQLELDNERLAFKLSEALAELEEREAQLKQLGGADQVGIFGDNLLWGPNPNNQHGQSVCVRSHSMYTGLCHRESSNNSLLNVSGDVGEERGRLTRNQSDSSLLEGHSESDCNQNQGQGIQGRVSQTDTQSFGADSTPPSLLLSEPNTSCGSPKRATNLTDCHPASHCDHSRLEEAEQFQVKFGILKEQHSALAEKYNALVFRHISLRTKRKSQLEDLRRRMDSTVSSLRCQIDTLQSQLLLQKKVLHGEETFRKRVESDYRRLQEDKRSLLLSVLNTESALRAKEREVTTLQKKVALLENTTADILARMLTLKYAGSNTRTSPPKTATRSTSASQIASTASVASASSFDGTGRTITKRHSVTDLGMV